jgi:AAA family ATP:ADP antiporter
LRGLFAFIIFIPTSTWAYFQQSDLAGHGFADRAARTTFFANLDRSVNTLTLLGQLFLTGRLLKWLGVSPTLIIMPTLSLIGFVFIGISPLLAVLAVFQVLRRAATFAFMRPAREVLFTVLRREDKYKAKSVIDTFAYRVGDQLGAVISRVERARPGFARNQFHDGPDYRRLARSECMARTQTAHLCASTTRKTRRAAW